MTLVFVLNKAQWHFSVKTLYISSGIKKQVRHIRREKISFRITLAMVMSLLTFHYCWIKLPTELYNQLSLTIKIPSKLKCFVFLLLMFTEWKKHFLNSHTEESNFFIIYQKQTVELDMISCVHLTYLNVLFSATQNWKLFT